MTQQAVEAFPLHWPIGYVRTLPHAKKHARFETAFAKARDGVIAELKRMGATGIIISTNVALKKDGLPYAVPFGSVKVVDDTGIAVYFNYSGEMRVLCCDAWLTLDDNMQAIHNTVKALRGIERWQVSEMLNRTFTGFKALPEQAESKVRAWWEVLGISPNSSPDEIKSAYRRKAMEHHPDRGGNVADFNDVQRAYQQATTGKP